MVCAHISDAYAQAITAPESIPFTMDLAPEYQIAARGCVLCAADWRICTRARALHLVRDSETGATAAWRVDDRGGWLRPADVGEA